MQIKFAIQGKSASSTDPRDFSLNSDYLLWKITLQGLLILTADTTIMNAGWGICYEFDGTNWTMASTNWIRLMTDDGWQYFNGSGATLISYFITLDEL